MESDNLDADPADEKCPRCGKYILNIMDRSEKDRVCVGHRMRSTQEMHEALERLQRDTYLAMGRVP